MPIEPNENLKRLLSRQSQAPQQAAPDTAQPAAQVTSQSAEQAITPPQQAPQSTNEAAMIVQALSNRLNQLPPQ